MSKSSLSWGLVFLLIGVFAMTIFGLTQTAKFEKKEPLRSVEGYSFSGSSITEYNGDEEVVYIPSSYAIGYTDNISGTETFETREEALQFLYDNYSDGAEGYFDFYSEIYEHSYPWIYEYSIDKPNYEMGYDNTITTIKSSAFRNNTKIKKIVIPKSIKSIELFAFQGCSSLEEIVFSEGLEHIGDSSFWGCAIKELVLPSTVETIDPYAFFYCRNLEKVVLSKNLKDISMGTFNGCTKLKSVTILSENEVRAFATEVYQTFSNCPNLEEVFVPDKMVKYYCETTPWLQYTDKYKKLSER